MKFIFVITSLLFLSNYSFSQRVSVNTVQIKTTSASIEDAVFDQYCLENALQLITLPAGKESQYAVAGELNQLENKQATYKDYGIQLKENETQYFRLSGTNMLLKVESIYRLRLAYAALQH